MIDRNRSRRFVLFAALALCASAGRADEFRVPVPRLTVYPGDRITDAMLEEKIVTLPSGSEAIIASSRDALIGKVARRTLLPGQPIASIAVDSPRVVAIGAQVKIVFVETGMQIVAYGIAQQAGSVGDFIRVRNQDSGLFVSGRVQADGSIRVSEG